MKVLANDFKEQWAEIRTQALELFDEFGKGGWYILGDNVRGFEIQLAHYWGEGFFAAGCGNGLDAIELSLRTLDIQKDDFVLTAPLSAFATTLAIIRAGGIPVFIDVDDGGHIDLDIVSEYLETNPQTKFFVPVHLYGQAMNLDILDKIRKENDIRIIEDCAQAIGAKYKSRMVGNSSDIATTSFYPTKNLGALGDGGAVVSTDEKLIHKFNILRNYGQSSKYHHELLGSNSRLDELHAAILKGCLLPLLDNHIAKRRENAKLYTQGIKNQHIEIVKQSVHTYSTFHLFPVIVSDQKRFISFLAENNIEGAVHYPRIIPDQPAMKLVRSFIYGKLDKAQYFSQHIVSLPIHPYLKRNEIQYVIDVCNNWQL